MSVKLKSMNDKTIIRRKKFVSYEKCSEYARKKKIKTMRGWFDLLREQKDKGSRKDSIPADPSKVYIDEWISWPAFLGTNNIALRSLNEFFGTLEETKEWFKTNKIHTVRQFRSIVDTNNKPESIPACPEKFYNVPFSELLASKPDKYLDFTDARDIVRQYNLRDYMHFRAFRRENPDIFEKIPGSPDRVYGRPVEIIEGDKVILTKGPWCGWNDFLKK